MSMLSLPALRTGLLAVEHCTNTPPCQLHLCCQKLISYCMKILHLSRAHQGRGDRDHMRPGSSGMCQLHLMPSFVQCKGSAGTLSMGHNLE